MFRFTFIILILFLISCGGSYVKYEDNLQIKSGNIQPKSPTLLLSYTINKETIFIQKDSENVKYYYKLNIEDKTPFVDIAKNSFQKNLGLNLKDENTINQSKSAMSLEVIQEEKLLKLWNGPLLLKKKQMNLIPQILTETGSEQLALAELEYKLIEEDKQSDKAILKANLSLIIIDKGGNIIFASKKEKNISTYLPDDDISLANFMGDILMGALKRKVNIRVNKHCRPQLQTMVNTLWEEMTIDLKKNIK